MGGSEGAVPFVSKKKADGGDVRRKSKGLGAEGEGQEKAGRGASEGAVPLVFQKKSKRMVAA